MAGRGDPFTNLNKKKQEAPEKKDQEVFLLSDDMQTLSMNSYLPSIGRGRGLGFLSRASGGISKVAGRGIISHHYNDDRWDDEDQETTSTERKMSLEVGLGRDRGITSYSPRISRQSTTDDQSDITGSRDPGAFYSRNVREELKVLYELELSLDQEYEKIEARVLDEQKVIFGRNREVGVGPKADFSNAATSNEVLLSVDIEKWLIICNKEDEKLVEKFEKGMMKLSRPSGVRVNNAIKKIIDNDRTETYCSAIRGVLMDNPGLQIVVVIFPTARDDRYAAVKKILCSEIPTPSQCVQAKTISEDCKFTSVMIKIILQMNVKLGGALWGVKLPFKRTMVCGMNTYHDSKINVIGFVASINEGCTHYFSRPAIRQDNEDLINGLSLSFESA